jgi:hypothetical protein
MRTLSNPSAKPWAAVTVPLPNRRCDRNRSLPDTHAAPCHKSVGSAHALIGLPPPANQTSAT